MHALSPRRPPRVRPPNQGARGFTTLELMVVVAILAILTALAVPSFTLIVERWRARRVVEDLQATIYLARSEAIKRGGNVLIDKLASGNGCTSTVGNTSWDCGWRVVTSGGTVIQQSPAPNRVEVSLTNLTGSIAVDRWGMLTTGGADATAMAMEFVIVPKGKNVSDKSAIRLCAGTGGRIVQAKGSEACP